MKPLYFPHPGEILRTEFLEELKLSQYRLAADTGIPQSPLSFIIKGRRSVTPDTALRLARYFGNSAEFWLGLQREFDLRKAREEFGEKIQKEVIPREELMTV
jgi:addiction module HigA family antidote